MVTSWLPGACSVLALTTSGKEMSNVEQNRARAGPEPGLGCPGSRARAGARLAWTVPFDAREPAREREHLRPGRDHARRHEAAPGLHRQRLRARGRGRTYPFVFNNGSADPFFGVTSPGFLDELTPWGEHVATIRVPDDQFVTSFSSKSELALNLSPERRYVSFMGYVAKPGMLDVSNANTPGVIDPGNGDKGPYYRVVAQLDRRGRFTFTETNAYSGDNGRAAITNDEHGRELIYAAGNAGQSKKPVPGVILGAGAQFIAPSSVPEADQTPGQPTPLGSFNITELGYPADKASKDNNYRAIAIHDNVVYYTKGSGGNGVNTVYFVDTTGKACPNGVGVPERGAQLPTSPPAFTVSDGGPVPTNMCILKGFPTKLAASTTMFPFGMWFANDHTLYVADEGSGDNTYSTTTGPVHQRHRGRAARCRAREVGLLLGLVAPRLHACRTG